MELKFKSGTVELDSHIPYVEDRLAKIRLISDGDAEGIWAMFTEEGKRRYQDDEAFGYDTVALCNNSLAGVPYGAYIRIEYQGSQRPVCICESHFEPGHQFEYTEWGLESLLQGVSSDLKVMPDMIKDPSFREFLLRILPKSESDVAVALKELMERTVE